eukprot:4660967-Prymnesium_polylepis.1
MQRVPRLAGPSAEPLRRGGAIEAAEQQPADEQAAPVSAAPPGYEVIEHVTQAGRRYFTYRTGSMTFRSRREAWRFFEGEVGREEVDPNANSDEDDAADERDENADLWSNAEEPAAEAPAAAADGGDGLLGAWGAQIASVFGGNYGAHATGDRSAQVVPVFGGNYGGDRAVECDVEAPEQMPVGTSGYHVPDMHVCDTPGCTLPKGHSLAHSFEVALGRRRPPSRATGIELLRSPSHPTAEG